MSGKYRNTIEGIIDDMENDVSDIKSQISEAKKLVLKITNLTSEDEYDLELLNDLVASLDDKITDIEFEVENLGKFLY